MQTGSALIIAIDGPSGSGKSSAAKGVAQRLGLAYLDTGAMYRAAAWTVLQQGIALTDPDAVAEAVRRADIRLSTDPDAFTISVDGTEVTRAIREPRISEQVSLVSTVPAVRETLIAQQREIIAGAAQGIVVEGRDITTVVAPDAPVRVLLQADPAARLARRGADLAGAVNSAELTDQVLRRDRDDATVAAFEEPAPGVTLIDSTQLTLEQVISRICALAEVH
ncbi:(d)CMP kinase [Granulicoccus phenolivorans]|uniref:(d)CMP kinase n=1 Tax=Granulicoccus phenolivorans TaxID=266854 RepID=UPI00041F806A|nr:(d)CMP kinase [Granulicoccus phenolivorans]